MDNNVDSNLNNELIKVKRKSNGKNSPVIGDNGFLTVPGDNSTALAQMMGIYNMPSIDLNSDEEVKQRIQEYFTYCFDNDLKPGVEGMGLAIGVDRTTLWDWETGRSRANVGSSRSDIIKKAKNFLSSYLENLGQNGKINPITFIFLMKNHNGYTDKQEITVSNGNLLGDALTQEEIDESMPNADVLGIDSVSDF